MPYGLEDTVDLKEKERRIDEAYHMRRWPYTDGRSSAALSPSYDKPRLRSYAAHRDGNEDVDTRPRRRRFDGGDSDDDDGGNDDDTYDSLPARSYARHARPRARHRRLSGEERKESDDSSYDTFDSRNDLADKHAQRSTRPRRKRTSAGRRRDVHVIEHPVSHSHDVVHSHNFPHYHRVTVDAYASLSSYSPWPGKTYGRMIGMIRVEQRADQAGNASAASRGSS